METTRIVVILHAEKTVYFEDVDNEQLNGSYGGDIKAYAEDNYTSKGEITAEVVEDVQYIGPYTDQVYGLNDEIDNLLNEDEDNTEL